MLSSLNANPLAFAPFTRNIGKSTVKGVNVEMLAKLSKQDLFTANVEYLDGKFNDFSYVVPTQVAPVPGIQTTCAETTTGATTTVNCSGKPFTRAPKWTALVGYQHSIDLGGHGTLRASVNAKITSSYYIATDYIANELQKSAVVANASLTYETSDGRWRLDRLCAQHWRYCRGNRWLRTSLRAGPCLWHDRCPPHLWRHPQGKILIAQPMCAGWSAHISNAGS